IYLSPDGLGRRPARCLLTLSGQPLAAALLRMSCSSWGPARRTRASSNEKRRSTAYSIRTVSAGLSSANAQPVDADVEVVVTAPCLEALRLEAHLLPSPFHANLEDRIAVAMPPGGAVVEAP